MAQKKTGAEKVLLTGRKKRLPRITKRTVLRKGRTVVKPFIKCLMGGSQPKKTESTKKRFPEGM